ncbi:docking protein 2 isoform X2 [Esox lucius]|uniref:docking protein 2 isoform X2 n=1 Tax=Esox lucius TaxID=8010 RepID=UPI000576215B|nr:docking protein 2 isoform X2 [Esox lucius]
MEEDIRKKGMLYLQQQRFGKKWKKVWSILYRESSCSISRLEFFECKDGPSTLEKSDKTLRKQQESKKVIKLSDCIRVSEVDMEGSPKDCGQFLIETTEKLFVFAVEMTELDDWTQKLCEIAFPIKWGEKGGMRRSSLLRSKADDAVEGMEDNSLYSGRACVKDFRVVVRRTEAAERCRLRGVCVLRTDFDSLLLIESKTGEVLFTWPYRFLRRFGRDKVTFSFEAGRRCDSGEGSFEFDTKQGNMLFQAVESAINLQRSVGTHRQVSTVTEGELGPRSPSVGEPSVYSTVNDAMPKDGSSPPLLPQPRLEAPTEKLLVGVKSLTLDTRGVPRKNQVKTISSCPLLNRDTETYSEITMPLERREQEDNSSIGLGAGANHASKDSDYSLPFDTINKNLLAEMLHSFHVPSGLEPQGCEGAGSQVDNYTPDPLYDSIDESAIRSAQARAKSTNVRIKPEHIYDEPEGCAVAAAREPECPTSLYDDPEEVRGHAWKIMGTVADPNGHEYPYNPHVDDYAVPKPLKRTFPPNATNIEEEDSPYDNVMVKKTDRENR